MRGGGIAGGEFSTEVSHQTKERPMSFESKGAREVRKREFVIREADLGIDYSLVQLPICLSR